MFPNTSGRVVLSEMVILARVTHALEAFSSSSWDWRSREERKEQSDQNLQQIPILAFLPRVPRSRCWFYLVLVFLGSLTSQNDSDGKSLSLFISLSLSLSLSFFPPHRENRVKLICTQNERERERGRERVQHIFLANGSLITILVRAVGCERISVVLFHSMTLPFANHLVLTL